MMGGLHIEMCALKLLGDILDGSGWTSVLSSAGVSSVGRADSFIKATHVTRTRHAHQVTAAALHILQCKAYTKHLQSAEQALNHDDWCTKLKRLQPQFSFWLLVRSFRTSNFNEYMKSLKSLVPWMFALDHTHTMLGGYLSTSGTCSCYLRNTQGFTKTSVKESLL